MNKLGPALRQARVSASYSLRELAYKLNTDHAYLHRIETGFNVPSFKFLNQLCRTLAVPPSNYVGLAELAIIARWREGRKLP